MIDMVWEFIKSCKAYESINRVNVIKYINELHEIYTMYTSLKSLKGNPKVKDCRISKEPLIKTLIKNGMIIILSLTNGYFRSVGNILIIMMNLNST
jgi:hypothetical protein